mmetsp:Transcript_30328/g.77099  ORF Transcript_30328/g.77099 Transcript_30328/m.77099 type:complete len:588 (+) Transcript_30328:52-1815(+)
MAEIPVTVVGVPVSPGGHCNAAAVVVSTVPLKSVTVKTVDEDDGEKTLAGRLAEDTLRAPSAKLLFLLCAVGGLEGADNVMLPCVFFALQRDLGLTLNNLAAMSLCQALAGNIAAPFWGIMADRALMTRKAIIIVGCILQGLITVVLAFVDDVTPMLMLRALNGAMLASLRPIANGIVADVTTETNQGKVFGTMQLVMNIGTMGGTLLGTNLARKTLFGQPNEGWRLAFMIIGGVSVLLGAVAAFLMDEPPHHSHGREAEDGGDKKAMAKDELKKLLRYFRMPTFCVLVLQGCFGAVPWNALGFSTLFYQVSGVSDMQASVISIFSQISGSMGSILGGVISDRLVKVTPMHGRAITAQISVLSGIPIAWFVFKGTPPDGSAFPYFLILMTALGLFATWCGTAVNLPILSQVVEPGNRATVMAWEGTLEGSCSAIFGNAMVGFLAQNMFGYHLETAHKSVESDPESARALGCALMLVSFCPWVACFLFYTLLHWSYPRDIKSIENRRNSNAELSFCMGNPTMDMDGNPCCEDNPDCAMEKPDLSMDDGNPKVEGYESPRRPRLSAAAASSLTPRGEADRARDGSGLSM